MLTYKEKPRTRSINVITSGELKLIKNIKKVKQKRIKGIKGTSKKIKSPK
jgi:hypothetical protein